MRLAVVGPFAVGVDMMNDEAETRTMAAGRPFKHFEVSVGIAHGYHRSAADVLLDADGFAGPVIDEIQLRQSHDDGSIVV